MKVYIFGNEDLISDNIAFKVSEKLKHEFKEIEFIKVLVNEDLPFIDQKFVIILDAVLGIDEVTKIEDINSLNLSSSLTVHDFDLGFQLKYLKKINKIGKVLIIGLPINEKKIDYLRIKSIFKKLVAQDMQGS